MFDLTELKKLAEKQDPFAIVILDTNVFMNDPYVYQWKTSNNFVFVISSTVHNELIVLNSSANQEKREKAGMALKQIKPLYGSKEAIAKGNGIPTICLCCSSSCPGYTVRRCHYSVCARRSNCHKEAVAVGDGTPTICF